MKASEMTLELFINRSDSQLIKLNKKVYSPS